MRKLIAGVVLGAGAAALYGNWRWKTGTNDLLARLLAARVPIAPATYDARELDGLPPPVQRYLRAVLRDGQGLIAAARFTHTGAFNMSEAAPNWRAFTSRQVVTTRPPGFLWDARIRMAPGLDAFVHDAYVAGEGLLHARLLGLVTVAETRGTPEVAAGELLRYLGEAMWYPTALLPSQGVRWTPIDDRSARATLTDAGTTVSLDFRFAPDGLLESIDTAARPRTVGGATISTPWSGRAWGYGVRGGMRIPLEAEVSWVLPDGPSPYWRARITSIEYEYAGGERGTGWRGRCQRAERAMNSAHFSTSACRGPFAAR